ncbi:MAG: amidohydrolase family protein [Actinobacteria bacterium]|nr:amidohydrolase family protein [Actinomycetota bacterium]
MPRRTAGAHRRRGGCGGPGTSLFLGGAPPPTEGLRAGAAIAIATDCNPGTSPTTSMPHAIATAAALYGIPPEEALTAATINPAWVLGMDREVGSLQSGKRADFVVLDGPEFAMVPYRPGHDAVAAVYVDGERVHG